MAAPALLHALHDPEVGAAAAGALGAIGPAAAVAVPELEAALAGGDPRLKLGAAVGLEGIGRASERASAALLSAIGSPEKRLRVVALRAIATHRPTPEFRSMLLSRWNDPEAEGVQQFAMSGNADLAPWLLRALHDTSEYVRCAAIERMFDLNPAGLEGAVKPLTSMLANPRLGFPLRSRAAALLGHIGPAARIAIPQLRRAQRANHHWIRQAAECALLRIAGPDARCKETAVEVTVGTFLQDRPPLSAALASTRAAIRDLEKGPDQARSDALHHTLDRQTSRPERPMRELLETQAIPALMRLLDHPDWRTRAQAVYLISNIHAAPWHHPGTPAQLKALLPLLDDPYVDVREVAARAIGWLGAVAESAAGRLSAALNDPAWRVRESAAWSLKSIAQTKDPSPRVRHAALAALGELDRVPAAALTQLSDDEDPGVREAARKRLGK